MTGDHSLAAGMAIPNDITDPKLLLPYVEEALNGLDDGELYLEYGQYESLVFDDNVLKQASFSTGKGFGLRGVLGEATAYAHASTINENTLKQAVELVKSIKNGFKGSQNLDKQDNNTANPLYSSQNPLEKQEFSKKIALLSEIDRYLRQKDSKVKQVSVSLSGQWQAITIIRADAPPIEDIRPLVRLNVSVIVEHNGRRESGSRGVGGRTSYDHYIAKESWQSLADEALKQAFTKLDAVAAPAGQMQVVLGPGWPGVLLHEAVGHGLEGDFNRKKTSAFTGLIGQRVASKGVTIVDDGTLPDRRGSLTVDDEGTPTQRTVLIEDGILKAYMQDRLNARLMGVSSTGNGRRESYAHMPMPRMTNTFMLAGTQTHESLIASVKKGIYADHFGGGQVDIVSGNFVFSATEAWLIEDGKLTAPIKGATLIGNGPEAMQKVRAIGNNLELDHGVGTCGKNAQQVPVGVGQPSLLLDDMTVGGTSTSS